MESIFDTTIDDSDIATLYKFYEMGMVEFVLDAQTLLFVYKQNSDNEHLNKDLTFFTNVRQIALLKSSIKALDDVINAMSTYLPTEFIQQILTKNNFTG